MNQFWTVLLREGTNGVTEQTLHDLAQTFAPKPVTPEGSSFRIGNIDAVEVRRDEQGAYLAGRIRMLTISPAWDKSVPRLLSASVIHEPYKGRAR